MSAVERDRPFIYTWHAHAHLAAELVLHAPLTRKYKPIGTSARTTPHRTAWRGRRRGEGRTRRRRRLQGGGCAARAGRGGAGEGVRIQGGGCAARAGVCDGGVYGGATAERVGGRLKEREREREGAGRSWKGGVVKERRCVRGGEGAWEVAETLEHSNGLTGLGRRGQIGEGGSGGG